MGSDKQSAVSSQQSAVSSQQSAISGKQAAVSNQQKTTKPHEGISHRLTQINTDKDPLMTCVYPCSSVVALYYPAKTQRRKEEATNSHETARKD